MGSQQLDLGHKAFVQTEWESVQDAMEVHNVARCAVLELASQTCDVILMLSQRSCTLQWEVSHTQACSDIYLINPGFE